MFRAANSEVDFPSSELMRALTFFENFQLGAKYFLHYNKLRRFPYKSLEEISQHQLNTVKNLIHLAYNHTTFYKRKYSELGIYPQDIKTWEDFKKLPTTTKDEIIQFREECIVDNKKIVEI